MKKATTSRSNSDLIVFGGGILSRRIVPEDGLSVGLGEAVALERSGKKVASGIWLDSSTYEGEWQDGVPHGDGRMVMANGDVYDGSWVHGIRSGFGRWWSKEGDEYSGNWKAGVQHGKGEIRLQSGGGFWGHFDCGIRSGFGVSVWGGNQTVAYVGDFVDDLRHGNGMEFFPHNSCSVRCDCIYDTDQLLSRQPVDVHKSNAVNTFGRKVERMISGLHLAFEGGEPLRGKPHRAELADGGIFAGQTRDGDIDGRGHITYWHAPLGGESSYDGQFKSGNKHGLGRMRYEGGGVYIGSWVDNVRSGFGVLEMEEEGERYEGEWKDDKPDGFGVRTRTQPDRRTQELGFFREGSLLAEASMVRIDEAEWRPAKPREVEAARQTAVKILGQARNQTIPQSEVLPSCMRGGSLVEMCLRAAARAQAAAGEIQWFQVFGTGPEAPESTNSAEHLDVETDSGVLAAKEDDERPVGSLASGPGLQGADDELQEQEARELDDGVPQPPTDAAGRGSRVVAGAPQEMGSGEAEHAHAPAPPPKQGQPSRAVAGKG